MGIDYANVANYNRELSIAIKNCGLEVANWGSDFWKNAANAITEDVVRAAAQSQLLVQEYLKNLGDDIASSNSR